MKKLFAALLVTSLALFMVVGASAGEKGKATSINGWVSESGCATKHAGPGGEACVKKCIEKGAKMVFVSDADKSVWSVDNPEALTEHLGHHVTIEAHVNAEAKSVHVAKVTMMAEK